MHKTDADHQEHELRDILQEIKDYDLPNIEFKDIALNSKELCQSDFLQVLKKYKQNRNNFIIIDVRSEKEYSADALPFSVNLPILNNTERHKVGLIYFKESKEKALSLAYYFAKKKEKSYIDNILKYTNGRKVIVYCWRGGARSKYTAGILQKNNVDVVRLQGGQKGFRKNVYDFLYNKTIPIISLSGITGCGKSEILEYIKEFQPDFPVLHLEECAGHASSVFGEIRYAMRNQKKNNQKQFETNIFMEVLPYINEEGILPVFLSESESKKIGGLTLPPAVQRGLEKEEHICLTCPIEKRIERLEKDYFASADSGNKKKSESKEKIKEQLQFLGNKLSKTKIEQYKEWIDNDQYSDFLKDIMENYYDKIYKSYKKEPLFVINNQATGSTVKAIFEFWNIKILQRNLLL
ncbi:MAG: tRNA 2-selenouridine(34) synthase MnmH [Spirochaetota bacterium]